MGKRAALIGVKTVHTAAFFSIGSCLVYLAYSGLVRRSDRRAALAGAVVTGEALVYAANGFRCPLTDVAERLGSAHGSVADIYMPRWIEQHLPFITGPIFVGALALHARNLGQMRRDGVQMGGSRAFASTRRDRGTGFQRHARATDTEVSQLGGVRCPRMPSTR
jgi:hypothetical protein